MGFLMLYATAWLIGAAALRPLAIANPLERVALQLTAGLAIAGVGMLAAGSYSLRAALLVLLAAAAALLVLRLRAGAPSFRRPGGGPAASWFDRICIAATLLALALAFLGALAPPTSWDAAVAHLRVPQFYAAEGRIHAWEGVPYTAFPQLAHVLFTIAYALGGETGPQLASWGFGALACALVHRLGRRLHTPTAGYTAAAMLATAPIFLDQAGAAGIDLAFAAFTLAALLALVAWHGEGRTGWLILAALLAGSSCGIRHTGYVTCALITVAAFALARPRARIARAALFAGLAIAGAAPWLLRSYLATGNPVFPFFAGLFSPGFAEIDVAARRHETVTRLDPLAFALYFWNIVMKPASYDGWTKSPGPWALLLGVPATFMGGPAVRAVGLVGIAGWAGFFFFQRLARYLLPFFAALIAVAGFGFCRVRPRLPRVLPALVLIGLAIGLVLHAAAVHFKVPAALGLQARDDYLARRVERYAAFQWAAANLPPGSTVLTLDPRAYYIGGRAFNNLEALVPLTGRDSRGQVEGLRDHGIDFILVPVAYLEQAPRFEETGVYDMVQAWRRHDRLFRLIATLDLENPRTGAAEVVEVYELRAPHTRAAPP